MLQRENNRIEARFNNLGTRLTHQLRKSERSARSGRSMSTVARSIFGLQEDIKRLSLPNYDFGIEKEIVNTFIISFLSHRRETKYDGECEFYGETLLNLYLDIFITLTCQKTTRKIEHKPGFLVNPRSGDLLELDVTLEEFRLAFEFQGDSHYINQKEIDKDKVKIDKCATNKVILIPVNIYQLESNRLMELILNSMKDAVIISDSANVNSRLTADSKHKISYKKACQRIYLAKTLFDIAIKWLDAYALRFRDTQKVRNPISTSMEAPRLTTKVNDMDVETLYKGLKHV